MSVLPTAVSSLAYPQQLKKILLPNVSAVYRHHGPPDDSVIDDKTMS